MCSKYEYKPVDNQTPLALKVLLASSNIMEPVAIPLYLDPMNDVSKEILIKPHLFLSLMTKFLK